MSPESPPSRVEEAPARSAPSRGRRSSTKDPARPIRRASVACVACRERKIKCDSKPGNGGEPCSHCKQLKKNCLFRFDDQRKFSNSRAHIKQLQDRIAALEKRQQDAALAVATAATPDVSPSIPTVLSKDPPFSDGPRVVESDCLAQTVSVSGDASTASHDVSSIPDDQDAFSATISNYQMMDWNFDHPIPLQEMQSPVNDPESRPGVIFKPAEARNHMITQLAAAMGQIDAGEPGQISSIHITSFLPPSSPESTEGVTQALEELADSRAVQRHLLDLYFTYQDPLLQILQKEPFMSDYANGLKTQYYSDFLLYAILLDAKRLSKDPSMEHLDKIYLRRAKHELVFELENPTIATIQALCIFANYRAAGLGHDKACLVYPGIAFRMLDDLRLNQDCSDFVTMGYLLERDQKVRHNVFWGCYVYDKFSSIYLGRPSTISLTNVTVPRPTVDADRSQHSLILVAWTDLCIILGDVIDMTNGPSRMLEQQSTILLLSKAGERLHQWLKGLPEEVQWKSDQEAVPVPGIFALHMQLSAAMIMLHRPFAVYAPTNPGLGRRITGEQLYGYTPDLSRQVCSENAVRISKMLLKYRQHYGIGKVLSSMLHHMFIAATTLISQISTDARGKSEDNSNEKRWLAVCLQALEDIGPYFHIGGRVHKVITSFLESCGYSDLASPVPEDMDGHSPSQQQQQPQQQPPETQRLVAGTSSTKSTGDAQGVTAGDILDTFLLPRDEFGIPQALRSYRTATQLGNFGTAAGDVAGSGDRLNAYQSQWMFHGLDDTSLIFPGHQGWR